MSDPISRLLEAIEAKEQKARAASPGPWRVNDETYAESIHTDDGTCVIGGGRWGGEASVFDSTEDALFIADNDPSSVLRRCTEDRTLVEWYQGWQETFRGPIPEGHTEDSALHFRMASEFVLNRLMASYGITWADTDGITEEEATDEEPVG